MKSYKFFRSNKEFDFIDNLPKNISVELLKKVITFYIIENHPIMDNDLYNELLDLNLECSSNRIDNIEINYRSE